MKSRRKAKHFMKYILFNILMTDGVVKALQPEYHRLTYLLRYCKF